MKFQVKQANKSEHPHIPVLLILLVLFAPLAADTLPLRFDLRDDDGDRDVSCVKTQQGGTCWTHAVMASMESNLMRRDAWPAYEPDLEPDLSEYHLDWWNGFNLFYNADFGYYPPRGLTVHMGGDYRVAAAYLSRGDGAVRDRDGQSYDSPPARRDTSYHYYYPRRILWFRLRDDLSNMDLIKRRLMEHGALGTCMYVGTSFLDTANGTFYQPPSNLNDPNHAITIVGWDDTMVTNAPAPGAWLCKNSWGSTWGSPWDGRGYFWISYYDKHAGRHPEMGCVSFEDVERMRYHYVYYHDYHGWRDTLQIREAVNIFVAEDRDSLAAVSFFAAGDSVNYRLRIYRSREDLQYEDYVYQQTGRADHSGLYTVDLHQAVPLFPEDSFFVYLYLDKGGHPYDRSSQVPVLLNIPSVYTVPASPAQVPSRASRDQSLFFDGGVWRDLQSVDSTANFCIKALVKESTFTVRDSVPGAASFTALFPNPLRRHLFIDYQIKAAAFTEIILFDIRGRKVRTLVSAARTPGYYWLRTELSSLSSGIYVCMLKTGNTVQDIRKVLIVK